MPRVTVRWNRSAGASHVDFDRLRWLGLTCAIGVGMGMLTACGVADRLVPAAGVVRFSDGSPVPFGIVECEPLDRRGLAARGRIETDGGFRLSTGRKGGVRPATYRVAVVQMVDEAGASHSHGVRAVDPRYARFETSGLTWELPPGGMTDHVVTVRARQ